MSFFKVFRRLGGRSATSAEVKVLEREMKTAVRTLESAPLSQVIERSKLSSVAGDVHINGSRVAEVENVLREGRLKSLSQKLGVDGASNITAAEEAAFKTQLKRKFVPETTLGEVDDIVAGAKRRRPELDRQSVEGLTPAQRRDIENLLEKTKASKGGGVITGLFLVVGSGALTYAILNDLCKQRNGCWYTLRVGKSTQSCKIIPGTCGSSVENNRYYEPCSDADLLVGGIHPNLWHFLNYYRQRPHDDPIYIKLCAVIKRDPDVGFKEKEISAILKREEWYAAIETLILKDEVATTLALPFSTVVKCSDNVAIGCTNCNSAAQRYDPAFFDKSTLSDTATVSCITNSSIGDVLGDLANDAANTVLGDSVKNLSKFSGTYLRYILIGLAIVFVIFVSAKVGQSVRNNSSSSSRRRGVAEVAVVNDTIPGAVSSRPSEAVRGYVF